MNRKNIKIGQRFGQRIVISYSHKNDHFQKFWNCKCDCGYESIVEQSRLTNGYANVCSKCANEERRKYKPINLNDKKYGKLLILKEDENDKRYVYAQCECGSIKRLIKEIILNKENAQCGDCSRRELATKHGHNRKNKITPEYRTWRNIKNRIFNSNLECYKYYGGRGITMCESWVNSFETFFRNVGPRPSIKHSLERIDNNGNYEPDNVKWALQKEQVQNRSITFKIDGKHINVKKLSKELKVHERTIKKLLLVAKFSINEIRRYACLTNYQKIVMGKSINENKLLSFAKLEKIKSQAFLRPKKHPLCDTWHSLKQRCNNPKNKDYYNYGAKGIKVSDKWATFKGFLEDILLTIGDKPSPEYQLDRIDNTKDYEINNLRWATKIQQARNKQNTTYLKGKGISAQEIASKYNVSNRAVIKLAKLGWDEEGIKLFAQLSFKEKKYLKIFVNNLTQEEIMNKIKTRLKKE